MPNGGLASISTVTTYQIRDPFVGYTDQALEGLRSDNSSESMVSRGVEASQAKTDAGMNNPHKYVSPS